LPLAFAGYFLLNRINLNSGKIFLIAMSLWFYAYFNPLYLPIIIGSIIFNNLLSKIIIKEKNFFRRKQWLALAVAANLGALCYYNYFDFCIENINLIFNANFNLRYLLLPLAISFFTFKQIAYLVDSYRDEVPAYSLIDYALFVSFFPQLIVGPILLHDELIPQFMDQAKKKIDYENIAKGLMAFAYGLAKKVLLADTFGRAVDWGYGNVPLLDSTNALLVMLFYTFQIYFDFSGYCDMATGLGLIFNIEITKNFDSPYRALSLTDFWTRWHMTLTRFFRRYLYIPLGGSRKGKTRTYLNFMLIFLVSGLWHGANFTFIIWGAIHGCFYILTRIFEKQIGKINPALNWLFTFIFINITWIYFRAGSLSDAHLILHKIFNFDFGAIANGVWEAFYLPETVLLNKIVTQIIASDFRLYLWMMTAFSLFAVVFMKNTNERIAAYKPRTTSALITAGLLIWSILSFSGVTTFIYVGF
jgi:alginate O-acetyltransferase complex protein AlgI